MNSVRSGGSDLPWRRRRATVAVKESLRELRNQLSLLNHQVGARLELKDVDLDCLELIALHGPLSPSALARWAGLHPATGTARPAPGGGPAPRHGDRHPRPATAWWLNHPRARTRSVRLFAGPSSPSVRT